MGMLTLEKKKYNDLNSLSNELGIVNAPRNIVRYMQKWHCNLQININTVDVENGYGRRIIQNVRIMRPYCKCNRCGYHSLWKPDDSKSKCFRHTYEKGYDTVFTYTIDAGEKKAVSLESAFDEYLRLNPNEENGVAVVYYGA